MCHTRFPSACYLLAAGPAVVLRDSMCRQREYVSVFCQVVSTIAGALPDMDFVVNCIDEPRVLLGEGTAAQRMSAGCHGASQVPYSSSPASMTSHASHASKIIYAQFEKPRGFHSGAAAPQEVPSGRHATEGTFWIPEDASHQMDFVSRFCLL